MPFIIGAFVIIVLVYWLWPLFLGIGIIAFLVVAVRIETKEANLRAVKEALPLLQGIYRGRYAILAAENEKYPVKCIRIDDIAIQANAKGVMPCLMLSLSSICYWDRSENDLDHGCVMFRQSASLRSVFVINGNRIPGGLNAILIKKHIESTLAQARILIFDPNSFDSELCNLMFMNISEANWASDSISTINKALEPIIATYNASLTNELLAANRDDLLKAKDLLEDEIATLGTYCDEACEALRKVYEYLCVPVSLKKFNSLDIAPLQVYSKRKDMRAGFESAILIKKEYDKLRNG